MILIIIDLLKDYAIYSDTKAINTACLVYVYEVAKVDKPEIYIGYCY
jgi:hypothetical protein